MNVHSALLFKKVRYDLYAAEKECAVCFTQKP